MEEDLGCTLEVETMEFAERVYTRCVKKMKHQIRLLEFLI